MINISLLRWILVAVIVNISLLPNVRSSTSSNLCTKPGQVKVRIGNNESSCWYFVHMKQEITKNFTKQEMTEKLEKIFKNVTKKVVAINITKIETKTIEYDIYTNDYKISAKGFQNYYFQAIEEADDDDIISTLNPMADSSECKEQHFMNFIFPESKPNKTVSTTTNCKNLDLPKATIKCKTRKHFDGTTTAYLDVLTYYETNCTLNLQNIDQLIPNEPEKLTTEDVTNAVNMLAVLTPSVENETAEANKTENKKSAMLFSQIADSLNAADVKIPPETLEASVDLVTSLSKNGQVAGESTSKTDSTPLGIKVVESLEKMAAHVELSPNQTTLSIITDTINMNVTNVANTTEDISYTGELGSQDDISSKLTVHSTMPNSAVSSITGNNTDIKSLFIYFTDSSLFPQPEGLTYKVNQVLTASISNNKKIKFNDSDQFAHQMAHPEIDISATEETKDEDKIFRLYKCVYLDPNTNKWSTEGCTAVNGTNPIRCQCNHLSSFSVIVNTVSIPGKFVLKDISYFGCVLSIGGLSAMIAIHWYFPKLRGNVVNQIHINLGISLLIVYILLMVGVERPQRPIDTFIKPEEIDQKLHKCFAYAALLHFFLMASWGWMSMEMYTMYRKFVQLFGNIGKHYVGKCAMIVYFGSAVVVAISFSVSRLYFDKRLFPEEHGLDQKSRSEQKDKSVYVSDTMCWLHGEALYYAFLLPVGILFAANAVGFVIVFKTITFRKKIRSNQKTTVGASDHLFRILMLSMLLGISWAFAIPLTATDEKSIVLICSWLFSIVNILQGFIIFLLFCVRRQEVRDLWLKQTVDTITLGYFSEKLNVKKRKASEATSSLAMESRSSNATSATNVGYISNTPLNKRKGGRLGELQAATAQKQTRSHSVV